MRRKSLFLLLIGPLLLVLLLTQLADVQAARPQQRDATPVATPLDPAQPASEPALDVGVPLSQPLLIRFRQQIPITVMLSMLRPLTVTATPTATLAPTGAEAIATEATVQATPTASVVRATATPTLLPTQAAVVELTATITAGAPLTNGEAITGVTVITGLLPITSVLPLIDTEAAIALTLTAVLTTPDAAVVPTVPLSLPAGTPTVGDLVPLTGTLPLTAALPLTTALPVTGLTPLAPGDVLTTVPPIFTGVGITMDLDLQFFITDTMTSTVPALLVLRFTGMPSLTLPVSITVNAPSTAVVSVMPVTSTVFPVTPTEELSLTEILTLTPPVTDTGTVTPSASPTATATPLDINALPVVTVTVPVTANIRSAPSLDGEIAQTVPGSTVLTVVAQNAAGDWLLLLDGNWIAVVVFGAGPPGLPAANDALIAALREAAANATPTPTPLPPPPTATPTATPTLPPFTPANVTATTNANLRSGPGTTFDIVGNTTFGQALVVAARDATGGWLRLDSTSWIAVQLVDGLPPVATIPVFDPNAPPTPTPIVPEAAVPTATSPAATPPVTETAPITGTPAAPLLPTATPAPGPTATQAAPTLSVDENVYLVEYDNIVTNYQRALTAIDRLVTSASGNTEVFSDQQWTTDMNTAIQLLRNAGSAVTRLSVPERFAAAQNSLATAATQYNQAADLLTAGVEARSTTQFDGAFSAISLGDATVAQASAALSAFRP